MVMVCGCGGEIQCQEILEFNDGICLLCETCSACGFRLGVEGEARELASQVGSPVWTDEAQHVLDRLPPYVEPLVRQEVETYTRAKNMTIISYSLMIEARNQGTVSWSSVAEARLQRVPAPVRGMARVELERTALERGMSEVTVSLMEEVKARYFGMGASLA